jgi:large subunit ribosomal protein L24
MAKTKKPSKQRKRNIYKTNIYGKRKLLVSKLDKPLVKTTNKKRMTVRKGDTVKILRGKYKSKTGKVDKVSYTHSKVYIKDIKQTNSRGQDKLIPFNASNLIIIDLLLNDNKRIKKPSTQKVKKNGK